MITNTKMITAGTVWPGMILADHWQAGRVTNVAGVSNAPDGRERVRIEFAFSETGSMEVDTPVEIIDEMGE